MPTSLRTEALPLAYAALDMAQRQAMTTIVGLLHSAIQQLRSSRQSTSTSTQHFPVDIDRSSRIAMLSGERGTGKTTVLVSIIKACDDLRAGDAPPVRQEHERVRARDEMPNELQQEVLAVARRTVWLEPIDMEPLPTSTNLLAAILARVGAAARMARSAPHGAEAPAGRRGLLEREREQDPLVELRRLQAVVATSWEDVPVGRRTQLDPHAYAAEVLQAENDRLSLNEKLSKVLDDLAALFDIDPLFVLPVDDFDLNPIRSLELLRIVRAISVPRLFTLVLGDQRVAEMIVRLGFTGTLAELAGRAAAVGPLDAIGADLRSMPAELAGHLVRKLIPPSQVIRLERMTVLEALWYRPPGAPEAWRLGQVLTACPLAFVGSPLGDLVKNLWDFLFARPTPAPDSLGNAPAHPVLVPAPDPASRDNVTLAHKSGAYAARSVFQAAPRRVADLWLSLEQLLKAVPDPADQEQSPANWYQKLLTVVNRYARASVAEDGQLSADVRRVLQDAIGRETEEEGLLDYEIVLTEPRVRDEFSVEFDLAGDGEAEGAGEPSPSPEGSEHAGPALVVSGRRGIGWTLRVQGQERMPLPRLEEPTAAACMLYHDLLSLGPTGFRRKRPLLWQQSELKRWAATEWRADDVRTIEVTWPAPGLSTFWEYDLFLHLWNEALQRVRDADVPREAKLERLLYGWLDSATAVLGWQSALGTAPAPEGCDWKALIRRLEELDRRPNLGPQRQKGAREWLISIACLLMPEMIGTRPQLTQPFATPKLRGVWIRAAHEIRLYRKAILDRFTNSQLPDLGRQFAAEVPINFPVALIVDEGARKRHRKRGVNYTPSVAPQPSAAPGFVDRFAAVRHAVVTHSDTLRAIPGVVDVRPGFKYTNGWSTGLLAIVVTVRAKNAHVSPPELLPKELDGIPVDVRPATPQQQLRITGQGGQPGIADGPAEEPLLQPGEPVAVMDQYSSAYTPPNEPLDEIRAAAVSCHIGPEASWKALKAFLEEARGDLAVGICDFTARHIMEKLEELPAHLVLVLDPGSNTPPLTNAEHEVRPEVVQSTLTRALSSRLSFVWAAVERRGETTSGVFPTAYRLSAVVQDDKVWLSTGSWRAIDQPPDELLANPGILASYAPLPREWHVVVENKRLAMTFSSYLRHDLKSAEPFQTEARAGAPPRPDLLIQIPESVPEPATAGPFRPMKVGRRTRVQPLLSPDNYIDHVLPLIRDARQYVYFQNPYIHLSPAPDPKFDQLIHTLLGKIGAGLDVRLILGDTPNARDMLEALEAVGFDMKKIRVQKGLLVQGIIVDDESVVIGSHRWSSLGLTQDRAASLLIHGEQIAHYFRRVFERDWKGADQMVSAERAMPQLADDSALIPSGIARVPWRVVFQS